MHGPRAVLPGVLFGSGLGETPTDAPPWLGEAPGACSAPCPGMTVTFPGKVSSLWMLWQGLHIPMPMCTCPPVLHVGAHPPRAPSKPTCTHVRFPGTRQGMRSDNPPPRQPPMASLWGHSPPSTHPFAPGVPAARFLLTPALAHSRTFPPLSLWTAVPGSAWPGDSS